MRAARQTMEDIHRAAGGQEVITIDRYAHLVGGCRMTAGEHTGVVDFQQRTFAVPNLYITDGSVLPTQAAHVEPRPASGSYLDHDGHHVETGHARYIEEDGHDHNVPGTGCYTDVDGRHTCPSQAGRYVQADHG